MPLQPTRESSSTLVDVIDRVLNKGLVINADICVSVAGVELLGIKIRAALASFATAAKYDLEFTNGTNYNTDARKAAQREKETCPQCEKRVPKEELPGEWCGWASARARETVRNTVSESPIAVE